MMELFSQMVTKAFTKVKWDSNIYFQCAHTMKPQIKELVQSGDLSIDDDDFATKQELMNMIVLNQRFMLGEQVYITNLWKFKTPIWQKWQYTNGILNHQYIILELLINENEIKYCCMQKTLKRITITYADTLEYLKHYQALRPGQQQQRCKTSFWEPKQQQKMQLYSDYYELVKFLLNSKEHEKGYDFFYENCHSFCTHVVNFLKKHAIK